MVFSSPIFLFVFLPAVLLLYFLIPKRLLALRNAWLLAMSLLFYAWGEPVYILLMLASIAGNYLLALLLPAEGRGRRAVVTLAVVLNIGLLVAFKYLNLFASTLGFDIPPIRLPIGISFFTFQALSYVLDVYYGNAEKQRNPCKLALYVSLFPQLIAGPIVRYRDVAAQIDERSVTAEGFQRGIRRFALGLAKKVLVADALARVGDAAFGMLPAALPTTGMAWLGAVSHALQMYYDFSGYSDMAIGMGLMFGFRFLENFDYPYIADSIRAFWRRWHISLSTWFRDYLYFPMGGSRKGTLRTYINLLVLFAAMGLWHGANWAYMAFGLYHGLFMILERLLHGRVRAPRVVRHAYTLLVLIGAAVIFKAADLHNAALYLGALFGRGGEAAASAMAIHPWLDIRFVATLLLAIAFCMPVVPWLRRRFPGRAASAVGWVAVFALLALSLMRIATSSYSPFVYFQF